MVVIPRLISHGGYLSPRVIPRVVISHLGLFPRVVIPRLIPRVVSVAHEVHTAGVDQGGAHC